MKTSKISPLLWLLAATGMLAACGGGNDNDAGSPTAFSVQPATTSFTAPTGTAAGQCVGGGTVTVFVYGGAAPYSVDNTDPLQLSVSATQVNRDKSFVVTVLGGCLTNGQINVRDSLNNVVIVTINNAAAASS